MKTRSAYFKENSHIFKEKTKELLNLFEKKSNNNQEKYNNFKNLFKHILKYKYYINNNRKKEYISLSNIIKKKILEFIIKIQYDKDNLNRLNFCVYFRDKFCKFNFEQKLI